jgi:hypothetical protein
MAREIYTRNPSDPNYKENQLETNDEIEMLLGQLRMILFTNRGEVLGAPDFGVNLEECLFSMNFNEYALRALLLDQMTKFCPLAQKYQVRFEVTFAKGTVRDLCLIDTYVDGTKAFGLLVK